jgi:putative addiction module component (TIGR02574 family)
MLGGSVRHKIFRFDVRRVRPYRALMPATLEALSHDALVLPAEQRLALARQLLESVDLEPQPGAEAAWEAEIARRIARWKAGESKPIPAGEVFARLRQIAP